MSPDFLKQVAARIKEERKRLNYKAQGAFAEALGIPERTYWDREKGVIAPDAEFLAGFCELGGDALYVLTGKRAPLHAGEPWRPYSPAEQAAAAIQELKLTKADADLLIAMASRLAIGRNT